jgi:hypothetical protein
VKGKPQNCLKQTEIIHHRSADIQSMGDGGARVARQRELSPLLASAIAKMT